MQSSSPSSHPHPPRWYNPRRPAQQTEGQRARGARSRATVIQLPRTRPQTKTRRSAQHPGLGLEQHTHIRFRACPCALPASRSTGKPALAQKKSGSTRRRRAMKHCLGCTDGRAMFYVLVFRDMMLLCFKHDTSALVPALVPANETRDDPPPTYRDLIMPVRGTVRMWPKPLPAAEARDRPRRPA